MRVKIKADIEKWQKVFIAEGFRQNWVQQDRVGYFYAEHTHPIDTAHAVLKGAMIIEMDGQAHALNAGERLDVPKSTPHSAKIGPKGCTFLIGVRV